MRITLESLVLFLLVSQMYVLFHRAVVTSPNGGTAVVAVCCLGPFVDIFFAGRTLQGHRDVSVRVRLPGERFVVREKADSSTRLADRDTLSELAVLFVCVLCSVEGATK